MQTIQLAENGLKRAKTARTFIDPRAIKFLIIHIGIDQKSQQIYSKNSLHESMLHIYYMLAAQKLYTQHLLYSLSYVTTVN